MPRKSVAALSVAPIGVRRVKPPADMAEPIKAIWRELVDSMPPDRFHTSDRPLLALYCRHLHQAHTALSKIEEHGACDGESLNPWLKVAEASTKQCAVLATKLRLAPQSRLDRKVAGPAARGGDVNPPWASDDDDPAAKYFR